jgi:hypothetical protein
MDPYYAIFCSCDYQPFWANSLFFRSHLQYTCFVPIFPKDWSVNGVHSMQKKKYHIFKFVTACRKEKEIRLVYLCTGNLRKECLPFSLSGVKFTSSIDCLPIRIDSSHSHCFSKRIRVICCCTILDFLFYCCVCGCLDRLCGLVVRVPGYRSRGPVSIPGATRFSEN